MKILLIVGTANDVFVCNLSKWLKKTCEIDIDIYEFYPSTEQQQNIGAYANVYSSNVERWFCKIKGIGHHLMQIYSGLQISKFLYGKKYDYIHCHWLVSSLVINKDLKRYCNRLYVTFWGGEIYVQKVLGSHALYMRLLKRLLKETDNIVGYFAERELYESVFPEFEGRYLTANLAPTVLEEIYNLMKIENRDVSKTKLGVSVNKKLVLIGYSGKMIHQHLEIIKELSKKNGLKDKICLLAPMTRGARKDYVEKVECALKTSGYDYLLFKDVFFTEEMMARMRNATDIALQFSTRDSYSRSIIECLCSKSILIYGSWLQYDAFFDYDGFSAIKVASISDGINELENVLSNFSDYSTLANKNSENGKLHNLWTNCIDEWVSLYK